IVREALGSPHVESRPSRGPGRETLLRLARPELSARVRDIDDADAILLVGTDPLHSSPILDLRIRKAMRRNGAKLAVATDRPTTLDGGADAVDRCAPGDATHFLSELSNALRTGDEGSPAAAAAEVLSDAASVVVIWGDRIAREGEAATGALLDIAAALDIAGKQGSGLLEIPDVTNARGLREAGCLPDAGPGLTQASAGKATEEIRAALESSELDTLLLFGVDPLRDFPDTPAWERALGAAKQIVCFSTFETATTAKADVVFPLETHAEKDGTVTHPDGRLQRVRPSAGRPGDIRPNWGVLAELSLALGHDTGIDSQPSAFAALTEAVPFYAGITDSDIAGRGVRWQDLHGASNLSRATGDDSPGSRSRGVPGESSPASRQGVDETTDALTLGTYRDLWVGPITELNPPLKFLKPAQRVELSPSDAEMLGLQGGDSVRVSQDGSSVEAEVVIRERIEQGVCFLIEGTGDGNANGLLNGSPVSVTIEKAGE
ncbi:MAG TPA: molybdopterin-dependent oxidoreductase, partial [Solirubrobacterales bacterium]|nr:molybdopterin-dependent oxidoreductase [Solirubrobacterales bacterium]